MVWPRASVLNALHDEEDAFRAEREAARLAGREVRLGLDWFAFVASFKGVLLEGLGRPPVAPRALQAREAPAARAEVAAAPAVAG